MHAEYDFIDSSDLVEDRDEAIEEAFHALSILRAYFFHEQCAE